MPHECTNCGRTFPDGSKEMLSGCPDCGGNKFQFAPSGRATSGAATSASDAGSDSTETASSDAAGTVERAAETVRDWVSSESKRSSGRSESNRTEGPDPSRTERTDPNRTEGPDSAPTDRPNSTATTGADRSWPDSDAPAESAETTDTGEFAEWPETARRPEDRSSAPADGSSGTRGAPAAAGTPSDQSRSIDGERTLEDDDSTLEDRTTLAESENTAQADARSEVVSTDELPTEPDRHDETGTVADDGARAGGPVDVDGTQPPDHGRVVSEPSGEQPSIEELRAELNEQFESIKIVSPGQYELNLMELYNREEYIISLQEDGRYVIDVPDSWRADEDS